MAKIKTFVIINRDAHITASWMNAKHRVTVEGNYESSCKGTEGLWVHNQEGSLQAVCEGHPGQVPKDQHEAKPIVYNIHGGQNSLLSTGSEV